MKTRAFKKVISVICVLALLMSLCVVSFAGTASAAETYVFNVNGVTSSVELNTGDPLPDQADYQSGIRFIGWYDKTFTTKYDTAGAEKNLYAKFSSTILDFENGKQYYYPNEGKSGYSAFGTKGSISDFKVVDDPVKSGNKVLMREHGNNQGTSFGVPVAADTDTGFRITAGTKYEVSFRYYIQNISDKGAQFQLWRASDAGIGTAGNKTALTNHFIVYGNTDSWQTMSIIFTAPANVDAQPYLLFMYRDMADPSAANTGDVYVDAITVTEITEKTYTFYNKGVKTTQKLTAGDSLPSVKGASFMGWYDRTLTTRYDSVSAAIDTLYAKYDGTYLDFETKGYYDPNGVVKPMGTGTAQFSFETAADPLNSSNHVMVADLRNTVDTRNFGLAGAEGANAGLCLKKGSVYSVSFKYYIEGSSEGVFVGLRASTDAGIGQAGGKAGADDWQNADGTITNTNGKWETYTFQFTVTNDTVAYPNIIMLVQDLKARRTNVASDITTIAYFDDIEIKPYVASTAVDDVVMDFENDFKWSVEGANNYTYESGNGYVNRGEIVADGSNHYFKVTDFKMKNKYVFFTVNDGKNQFEMVNGGLYTVSFDYKVEHSETATKLGLTYIKPTTSATGVGIASTPIAELDSFEYRDDTEWNHVEYSFCAEFANASMNSLGIYLFNSTAVPLEYATVVYFDNIEVQTHSITGEDNLIVFDTLGGNKVASMTVKNGTAPATLPTAEKYGYDFIGWKYDVVTGTGEDAVVTTYDLTTSTIVNDSLIHAYAVWKLSAGVIELNFRTNVEDYDTKAPTLVAYPGQPVKGMPADPVAVNQKFVGWYLDRALTKAFDVNSAPSENTTLFAKWETDGALIDYESFPVSVATNAGQVSDRYKIVETSTGNHVLRYDLSKGTNSDAAGQARAMLHTGDSFIRAYEGLDYTVTFKYQVESFKSSGGIYVFLSSKSNTWSNFKQQTGSIKYSEVTDGWVEASISFTASILSTATSDDNYMSIAISGDAVVNIDDVVVILPENEMNVYGSAIRFNTNGGKGLNFICGDVGDTINLPTPKKPGYKFLGWYLDKAFEKPFTDTVYGEESVYLYAKWQLGKFSEGFEDYPSSVKALGIAGAYSIYNSSSVGFDPSNIHGGKESLFRNGTTAGDKVFTLMRTDDYALNVGESYTLTMYVKPTSIGDATATISLVEMSTFTGIAAGKVSDVVAKVSDLKEGEWQQITLTFTANSQYYGISTSAGNDMYFDDISVTLFGFTGSDTGDSSVSPLIILAIVILSAGAMLITGKKVFSK